MFGCFLKLNCSKHSLAFGNERIVGTLGPKSRSVETISGCLKARMSEVPGLQAIYFATLTAMAKYVRTASCFCFLRVELQQVREACSKFESLRNEFRSKHTDWCDTDEYDYENIDVESISLDQEIHDDQNSLRSRVLEQLDTNSNTSISMTELAEKIDRLVNKIVSLETAVTSQNALVNKLKSENDELQAHARSLEEEKDTLMENADKMSKRLKELEEELYAGLFHDVKAVDAKPEIEIKEDSNKAILDDDSAVLEDKMSEGEIKRKNVAILETSIKEEDGEEKQSDQPTQQEQGEAQDLSEDVNPQELELEKEKQPNWRQLFLKGLEDREKVLLEEYTSILRDYKDARWKLGKVEKKNRDNFFDLAMEIRELRGAVASKDNETKLLKQKLGSSETNPEDSPATVYKFPTQEGPLKSPTQVVASPYLTDLQSELLKLKNKKKHDGYALQSDAKPIYRHLREIQTELSLWLKYNAVLKDDLQGMLLSLCHIQDEISRLSSLSSEGENMELISKYQVAKFQGEVLNMKQENNKVADELQVGLNRVDGLKVEVEKTLARLDGELGISVSKSINNPKCSMKATDESSHIFVALVSTCFDLPFPPASSILQASGIFFGGTSTVEDEYLRAVLDKQSRKGFQATWLNRCSQGKKKTEHIERFGCSYILGREEESCVFGYLSLSSDTGAARQGNVWCPSFLSSNGPLTGEDSVMKDATTAMVVSRNFLTPRDNRLLSRLSDELVVQESLALSVQCAGSVSNMGQRLLTRTCQVESLTAEVEILRQEVKQLKRENRDLHILANNYSTSMKRKLDQLQESEVYALTGQERGAFALGVVALQKSAVDGADLQPVFCHD
ncbi:outer dense fiber protein 2-like [Pyrus ussuriensis x Pyrus communis]|uniref:Outer dense fiber protein 2-like n=1 Tax=Pyrus ussuriensis x Pyrus communis TaxID=2448454 RepID=A0A5N5HRK4_9ROSA|nr:outer dense fiber protein 2-like [Pyrus ussuriensis x Pyrus communis]